MLRSRGPGKKQPSKSYGDVFPQFSAVLCDLPSYYTLVNYPITIPVLLPSSGIFPAPHFPTGPCSWLLLPWVPVGCFPLVLPLHCLCYLSSVLHPLLPGLFPELSLPAAQTLSGGPWSRWLLLSRRTRLKIAAKSASSTFLLAYLCCLSQGQNQ